MASGDEELVNDVLIDSKSGEHGTLATATSTSGHQVWPRRFRLFLESPRLCGWQRQLDADARVAM
ncbi:hypothetical protein EBA05_07460 [Xanthomonas oryzae pv. oryzae]|nr:hypothetical protein AXO1947_13360 [Xanthomonas oryzae pv. oryzae]AUI90110.1 hypothetical protein BVV16_07835 [Xanthomonas oryzae pv. oryzae]AUJ12156.1 hypothetical protein BVV20_07875 [Xanthomonas oryzae pv. oryzae]AUJ15882.1 hypothetical protein BVV13_07845 [Xanthomonas oryzae pv. oryzae]AVU02316.1 hypothetical protein C0L90_07430 [Xanthomonas oryzae pv. oryzae]